MRMTARLAAIIAICAFCISACGSNAPSEAANDRVVSRSDYGPDWPFTLDSGTLRCDAGNHVVFVANGRPYAINGSAKSAAAQNGYGNSDDVVATKSLGEPEKTANLPLAARRRAFAELVRCENLNDDRKTEKCKTSVRADAKISKSDESLISSEGVMLSWPPLTPMRASVSKIIQDGLTLCK